MISIILEINVKFSSPFDSALAGTARKISLHDGEMVFRQGDTPFAIFGLIAGRVELQRHTQSGHRVIIHNAKPGETFAEASLFSESYHCDALVLESSEIIAFDRQLVLEIAARNPDVALALSQRFAAQIQTYRRKIELLAIDSAQERVFAALADGLLTADIKTFSAEIGLAHETVYRVLATLVQQGLVRKKGRGLYAIEIMS